MALAASAGELLSGRYRLESVIGRGGMGVVWQARDELLHRDVAIKETVWPPQLDAARQHTLRERAMREARAQARLEHPNIVTVYDVIDDDSRPWIVMRLLRYRSLREVIADDGPLATARAARIGLGILAALRAAHAAGVLHRDVKPGNVLIGPQDQVVLTDFGIAIADGNPGLTTSGVVIGSPSYLAPERARDEPATAAADLWSLGATLYAAVEGRPPFEREGTMAVLAAVMSKDPDPPRLAGPLWPVIRGLLTKNPGARLSADETAAMLGDVASEVRRPGILAPQATLPMPGAAAAAAGLAAARPASEPGGGRPDSAPPTQRAPVPASGAALGAAAEGRGANGRAAAGSAANGSPADGNGSPADGRPADQQADGDVQFSSRSPSRATARRRAPRLLAAAVALAVLAIIAGIGVFLASSAGRSPTALPRSGRSPSAASAKSHSAAGQHRGAGSAARSPVAPGKTAGGPAKRTVPAGYYRYRDPSGFSIAVPDGWTVSHDGHLVYISAPAGGSYLLIDQTNHPKPNALADWREQEAARLSTYPGYQRIRLAAVSYPQAEQAADWEFSYLRNGERVHILNRNVLVDSVLAYALYWSTPAGQWTADYHFFASFAATFEPASAGPGS